MNELELENKIDEILDRAIARSRRKQAMFEAGILLLVFGIVLITI